MMANVVGGEHFDVDGGQHAGVLRNNGRGRAVAGAQTPPICVSDSQLDQTTKGMHSDASLCQGFLRRSL
jgi:hypothetical protein